MNHSLKTIFQGIRFEKVDELLAAIAVHLGRPIASVVIHNGRPPTNATTTYLRFQTGQQILILDTGTGCRVSHRNVESLEHAEAIVAAFDLPPHAC